MQLEYPSVEAEAAEVEAGGLDSRRSIQPRICATHERRNSTHTNRFSGLKLNPHPTLFPTSPVRPCGFVWQHIEVCLRATPSLLEERVVVGRHDRGYWETRKQTVG